MRAIHELKKDENDILKCNLKTSESIIYPIQVSREFPALSFVNHVCICTWIRGNLKDAILWSIVMEPEMGKQNRRATEVFLLHRLNNWKQIFFYVGFLFIPILWWRLDYVNF